MTLEEKREKWRLKAAEWRKRHGCFGPRPKRKIIIDGDIGIVELTKGYFAGIDSADADFVAQWNWSAQIRNGNIYAARSEGNPKKMVYLHRALCPGDHENVDHVNGVTLDFRRFNLRPCSRTQNVRNSGPKGGTSEYKGVFRHTQNGNWNAQITKDRKCYHLGSFSSEMDAAVAYDLAANEMHGDFARLNFPAMKAAA